MMPCRIQLHRCHDDKDALLRPIVLLRSPNARRSRQRVGERQGSFLNNGMHRAYRERLSRASRFDNAIVINLVILLWA